MPGKIRKLPNRNRWRVYWGRKTRAFGATKKKAEAQLRLLKSRGIVIPKYIYNPVTKKKYPVIRKTKSKGKTLSLWKKK